MIRHSLPSYADKPFGTKIVYGRGDWASYSVWIIPGTIDERA